MIDLFYPPKPPTPKGVTFVRNLMRATKPPEKRKGRTRAEYLMAERARYVKRRAR